MNYRLIRFLSVLVIAGCSINPIEVTTFDQDTGKLSTHWLSNSLCSITRHGDLGLFLEEKGVSVSAGEIRLWAYNLGESALSVQLKRIDSYPYQSNPERTFGLVAGAVVNIFEIPVRTYAYANKHQVGLDFVVNELAISDSLQLTRERHETYMESVGGCRHPQNTTAFVKKIDDSLNIGAGDAGVVHTGLER